VIAKTKYKVYFVATSIGKFFFYFMHIFLGPFLSLKEKSILSKDLTREYCKVTVLVPSKHIDMYIFPARKKVMKK